jgi:serine/threonine-protein kinase
VTDLLSALRAALGPAYRIEREFAVGAMGRVFLATAADREALVLVTVVSPDLTIGVDPERFAAEVARASKLEHRGISPALSAGSAGGLLYFVTEHCAAESLRALLAREGRLPFEEAHRALYDLADALAYAHSRGVAHTQIRPDTVLVDRGRAILSDVGAAWALSASSSAGPGAPGFAAAAQTQDVLSLAAVGYQMFTGEPPFLSSEGRGLTGVPERVATAIGRALRGSAGAPMSASEFRDSLGLPVAAQRARLWRWGIGVAALLAVAAVLWGRQQAEPSFDPNLVAVAPFEVLSPDLGLWREGLIDLLSANLDGAGSLRAVAPTVVLRRFEGRADLSSASRLGRSTGARLVVFGRVVSQGGDSVRLTAQLADARASRTLSDIQLWDPDGRMDRIADSLTVRLLREIGPAGRSRVRLGSLGSTSLPALKAFLQAEHHFRRTHWDSALALYERAIELDSTFSLALYRAGIAIGWQSSASDSVSRNYLLRAAAHNRGLAPSDSMLVVAESLSAALEEGPDNPSYWEHYRRLYATTAGAVRRYPSDPEAWYEYADARYHYPAFSREAEVLAAFDRAIALDSSYAPAYLHPMELTLASGGPAAALRYMDSYLALEPRDIFADGIRLARRLVDPRTASDQGTRDILDTASNDLLVSALELFRSWADSSETAVRIARLIGPGRRSGLALYSDTVFARAELASALAYRGRLAAADSAGGRAFGWLFAHLAAFGALSPETATARFSRSLRNDRLYPYGLAVLAPPWWAARRDTASLRELARRADSTARAARNPMERAYARYAAHAARAMTQLVRGDTAGALSLLMALPDTACERCVPILLERARLLEAARRDREASTVLAADPPGFIHPSDGLWMLLRGRVAERLGDRETARRAYQFVAEVWRHADPILQGYVEEARAALRRLATP